MKRRPSELLLSYQLVKSQPSRTQSSSGFTPYRQPYWAAEILNICDGHMDDTLTLEWIQGRRQDFHKGGPERRKTWRSRRTSPHPSLQENLEFQRLVKAIFSILLEIFYAFIFLSGTMASSITMSLTKSLTDWDILSSDKGRLLDVHFHSSCSNLFFVKWKEPK